MACRLLFADSSKGGDSMKIRSMKLYQVMLSAIVALMFGCADTPVEGGEDTNFESPGEQESAPSGEPEVEQQSEELGLRDGSFDYEKPSWPRRYCAGPHDRMCPRDQYCSALTRGKCPSKVQYGVCAPRPQFCTKIFKPVCGCNGKTYGNACAAAAAGVAVAYQGECKKEPPKVFCGGIAGIECPGHGYCYDDPSDSCDPRKGGADCGGLCFCPQNRTCAKGWHWDASPKVCSCVKDDRQCPTNPCAAALCITGTMCVVRDCKAVCEPLPRY